MRVSVSHPVAALAVAGALLAIGRPASAQQVVSQTQLPQFTLRAGGYFTSGSSIRHQVGSSFIAAGLDYDIHQAVGSSRTIISVDYIDRSNGGNSLRIFPVTVGELVLSNSSNDVQSYYGIGVGGYFTHSDFGTDNQHDNLLFGGYAGIGLIYNHVIDLDLRYHVITPKDGINPSGLEATVGIMF
jgi:hypothetical protein